MKIFSRYVLKEMIGPTVLGFVFYTSIILMRQLFDMAGLIIKRSLSGAVVGKLLVFILPHIVVLTLPMSLLFGILIAVGRLSSDSEIVAMRALGISTRTIYRPVFLFSFLMFGLNFYLINFVMPESNRQFVALQAELTTSAAENVVKPRVFHTGYANLMIYVDDVDAATGQWKGVFVADSRTDESRDPQTPAEMGALTVAQDEDDLAGLSQQGAGQRIIAAQSGNLALIGASKEIWMNLTGAETHVWDPRRPDRYDLTRNASQRILLPSSGGTFDPNALGRSLREMDLKELLEAQRRYEQGSGQTDRVARNMARVEIHKKFAIPFACIAFGVLGLPLGITNRRGGKSSGFTLSIAIIVFYYLMINNGEQLAANGKIPAALGMWGANLILFVTGLILIGRANRDFAARPGGGSIFSRAAVQIRRLLARRSRTAVAAAVEDEPSVLTRFDITFPNILDRYILREFLKVLALVLLSVAALSLIIDYTDKAKDAREHGVAASTLLTYYRFYIFSVLNWTVPISVLVSTLVTFALLSKNNEVTAVKSSGVSLYRIGLPVLAVAALMSVFSYLLLDFILPYSSQRLEELKRQIDGKPPLSAADQQKLWYLGKGRYLINFLDYDRDAKRLTQVQVFELHPTDFRMIRRVYANRAVWNGKGWVFSDGWVRSFPDNAPSTYTLIKEPLVLYYPETPDDFALEVRLPDQMTYAQLRRYLATLRASGYAADALAVKLYEKTSWPALSIVMALIALPFAFRMGKRGALYGIGLALLLGIIYFIVFGLFMKFGEVGNLPPLLAAWAANILFGLAAGYMFLNVET
ncbi:MAG TPA: LPS export ABC transporter permease LptG [Thermoanaerobaculia bacterium]|nr:LPS export ABC transporter permease LptG [Thermoanaerobaculia bacterium]